MLVDFFVKWFHISQTKDLNSFKNNNLKSLICVAFKAGCERRLLRFLISEHVMHVKYICNFNVHEVCATCISADMGF